MVIGTEKGKGRMVCTGVIKDILHPTSQSVSLGSFFFCLGFKCSQILLFGCQRTSITWTGWVHRGSDWYFNVEWCFWRLSGVAEPPVLHGVWQTRRKWVLCTGCGLDSHKAPSGSALKDGWIETEVKQLDIWGKGGYILYMENLDSCGIKKTFKESISEFAGRHVRSRNSCTWAIYITVSSADRHVHIDIYCLSSLGIFKLKNPASIFIFTHDNLHLLHIVHLSSRLNGISMQKHIFTPCGLRVNLCAM